jgi:hypothetical protein
MSAMEGRKYSIKRKKERLRVASTSKFRLWILWLNLRLIMLS